MNLWLAASVVPGRRKIEPTPHLKDQFAELATGDVVYEARLCKKLQT